ncbi:unnamed protein product, partial [Symbiodinium microadriaticum]
DDSGDEGAEPGDDGVVVGDVGGSLPQSKSELLKLRQSFKNTMHLCARLYADRCGITTVSTSAPTLLPEDPDASEQWFLDECKKLEKYWRVLVEIGSARSWSQIQFHVCQPNSLAVVLLNDRSAAQAGLDVIREVRDAVLAAERAAAADSGTPPADREAISALLQDLAWNRLQTARESWLVCEEGQWRADDPDIQLQAEHLFSGEANTKWSLEDLFSHLATIARSTNLPTAMNKSPTLVTWLAKLSGTASNQTAAAATALLRHLSLGAGVFLTKGSVFRNTETSQTAVSLGFRKYGALMAPLVEHRVFFSVEGNSAPRALRTPLWAFQTSLAEPLWLNCNSAVCHPLSIPNELRGYVLVLEQVEAPQDPIKSALKSGVFLTLQHLKALHAEFRFPLPKKGKGGGKHGSVIKSDYAAALLLHFFGDKMTDAERGRMMDSLMGKGWDRNWQACQHSSSILEAYKALDPVDKPAFVKLAAVAADEEKLKEARAERADVKLGHMSPQHETPQILRKLLPTGASFQCRFNRHPQQMRYQVYIFDIETGSSA